MKHRLLRQLLVRTLFATSLCATSSFALANEQFEATHHSTSATWCSHRCDSVITDWSLAAFQIIKAGDGYVDPMAASRSLAMMHVAMHDAANAARPRYQRYALATVPALGGKADAAVAAATAAHDVLLGLYPQPQAVTLTKAQLEKTMLEAGIGATIEAGTQLGKAAARAMLAKRAGDGSSDIEPYIEGTQPGQYRFTAPFDFAAAPHWRRVTPFALASASQFRSAPPPALTSEQYGRHYEEVKLVGGKNAGNARSIDETHYAAFWYEFSDIGTCVAR